MYLKQKYICIFVPKNLPKIMNNQLKDKSEVRYRPTAEAFKDERRIFLTFIAVGVVNTLFGSAIMFVLYNAFGCSYWVSSFCNYFFGSILSYFLNKHFTFHYQGTDWQSMAKFALNIVVCYVIAYSLALPLARAALEDMHLSQSVVDNVAMLIGVGLFTVINYAGQRFFAFRK